MISVEIKSNAALRKLQLAAAKLKDRKIPNRQLAVQLMSWVGDNFDGSGSRLKRPWAPLQPATLAAKARKGYSSKPLMRTGNLRQSFAGFSDNDEAGVGAQASFGVDYAEFHENGVPENNLPKRQMLPPQEVALGYGVRIYDLYVSSIARG
jgi:phage gpG-like protein